MLVYMVKVAVYLIAFYLVYLIMLSRDTSYARNRVFILFSIISSLIFPLITLQTLRPMDIQFFGKFLSEVLVTSSTSGAEASNSLSSITGTLQVIFSVYIIVAIALIFKLLTDLLNLLFLIMRQKSIGSRIIRFYGFNTAGFSAMGYIFISSSLTKEETAEIIKHEQNHLNKNHFLDILLIETITALQWFNPAIHLFNKSLRAIHEYQADQDCLNTGIKLVNYQNLLLSQVFKSRVFNLTNSFSNPSLIKKRMIMMTKKRTSTLSNIKLLTVFPVLSVVFLAISAYKEIPKMPDKEPVSITTSQSSSTNTSTQKKILPNPATSASSSDTRPEAVIFPPPPPPPPSDISETVTKVSGEEPFVVVDEMPMFPGGDAELLKYIGENTIYPKTAKEQNLQGRVIIRFCITADGSVNQISVLKGVAPELDAEAIRVVNSLPAFKPGRQGGKEVPVWYMVPIAFTLK